MLGLFDGKVFAVDYWAFLTPLFPCEVCQTLFFNQYQTARYELVGYYKKNSK